MKKCLSCKHSYFRCDGKVDKLICNIESTPDKDICICECYEDDIDFLDGFPKYSEYKPL